MSKIVPMMSGGLKWVCVLHGLLLCHQASMYAASNATSDPLSACHHQPTQGSSRHVSVCPNNIVVRVGRISIRIAYGVGIMLFDHGSATKKSCMCFDCRPLTFGSLTQSAPSLILRRLMTPIE